MTVKLHLHANFPHAFHTPNAAIGYLKGALLKEASVNITNVYWYLMPRPLLNMMMPTLGRLQSTYIHRSYASSLIAAYLARFLYKKAPESTNKNILQEYTPIHSMLESRNLLDNIKNMARMFIRFVDNTIENENLADADIAGFTVKFYQWFTNAYVWSKLKKLNPNITIVVGGIDSPEEAKAFMNMFKNIDYAVWGEGEVPLKKLVASDKNALNEVPQLVYRNGNGTELCTSEAQSTGVTTSYFADHADFFQRFNTLGLHFPIQIPIFGTRYCQWNRCKFCNLYKGGVYYERPAENVIAEIEHQSKTYGVDKFVFLDSDIRRKNSENFEELLSLLLDSAARRRNPYDILAEISPLTLKKHHAEMMSKIRINVQVGFEALTDSLLKNMDKMHRFPENIHALKLGSDYGLDLPGLNILRNLPGSSQKDVIESIKNIAFLRFYLKKYTPRLSELALYRSAPYFTEVDSEEREKRWVVNFMYTEFERLGLIQKDLRWYFFGFRANNLMHFQLWDQLSETLGKYQSSNIHYSWIEFPDGSSLLREYNEISGDKEYLFDKIETNILKFCDEITSMQKLKKKFPHQNLETVVSQLREENLLYYDKETTRLISVLSTKALQKMK